MAIMMYSAGFVPGVWYTSWRLENTTLNCPKCGASSFVPPDSPRAQQALSGSTNNDAEQNNVEDNGADNQKTIIFRASTQKSDYLVPHTKAWFDLLEQLDPQQAILTKDVLAKAGNSEVCSVCGDISARDYQLLDEYKSADTEMTIRLCKECKFMRGGNVKLLAG